MKHAIAALLVVTGTGCAQHSDLHGASSPNSYASSGSVVSIAAEPIEAEVGVDDPEYWAVLHVMESRGLMLDKDTEYPKEVLDCAVKNLKDLYAWSRTQSTPKLRGAWGTWINYELDEIGTLRTPKALRAEDPSKVAMDAANRAGSRMAADIDPPAPKCAP